MMITPMRVTRTPEANNSMQRIIVSVLLTFFCLFVIESFATAQGKAALLSKTKEERDSRMQKAELEQYCVRRVEFTGNVYTRDKEIRMHLVPELVEGNLFSRDGLLRALTRFSKNEFVYPVTVDDVRVLLDEVNKDIDMVIKFKERKRR